MVFSWSADDPPLHARYQAEWKFRNPDEEKPPMQALSPAEQIRSLDIVQEGDPLRRLSIEVEHQDVDGTIRITTFEQGMARLVCHEVDHLFGRLYRSRMRPGVEPIPVSVYQGTGQQWTYQ